MTKAVLRIVALLILCPLLAQAGPPRVSMENSPMFISDLAVHTFTIRVDRVDELFAFSVTIDYDAADILVLGALSLDFLSHTGSSTARFLDWSTPGTVQADESILGISPQTTPSGQLLSVFFRVPTGLAGVAKRVPIIISSCRMRDEINHTIDCESDTGWIYLYPAMVRTKVFLQGPFVPATTSMHTLLRDADYPDQRTSPYAQDPVSYGRQLPSNIVDWVLVQLRAVYNGAVLASKSCFLRTDGLIVYPDSTAVQDVPFAVSAGNYYIVVRHRSHLGIQSANAVALGGAAVLYDFTTGQGQAYGTDPMYPLLPNSYGCRAGDGNYDSRINSTDRIIWNQQNGSIGYREADYDLSARINSTDNVSYWAVNNGKISQIP
jgi:hypothetical protein